MTLLEVVLDKLLSHPITALLALISTFFLSRCIYRLTLHPLAHIPGPLLPRITSCWLHYHAYIGDEARITHKAHAKYGPFVRVSPHEVDISDADAVPAIYVAKGGFQKAPWYVSSESLAYNSFVDFLGTATAILISTDIRPYSQRLMLSIEHRALKPSYRCFPLKISETTRLHYTSVWTEWWKG
jgi:hypothetical protein